MKTKSTRQLLKKIPSVPCLYRHTENGAYYGIRKYQGKIITKALVTANGENISDRKIAEGALRSWMDGHENEAKEQTGGSGKTFAELWAEFIALKFGKEFDPETYRTPTSDETKRERLAAKKERTKERKADRQHSSKLKYIWMNQTMKRDFPGFEKQVADVTLADLETFLTADGMKKLKPVSFNLISRTLNAVLKRAVNHEVLKRNPFDRLDDKIKARKNSKDKERVPTIEECEAIVAYIRKQDYPEAEDTADYLELLHRAALGQAELDVLRWENINWVKNEIEIKRQKTGVDFTFPIYPFLKPFLTQLWEKQGKPATGKVTKVSEVRRMTYQTCNHLSLPQFSPRDLRKARIRFMYVDKGIPADDVAAWQGHRDATLIINTYGNGVNAGDSERRQKLMTLLN